MNVLKTRKGFTLLEILIAMGIVTILAVSTLAFVPAQINRGYDTRRKDDLNNIKTNLELYYENALQYPSELPGCGQPLTVYDQTILDSMPCDPITGTAYYYHIQGDDPQSFRLYTILATSGDLSIEKAGCTGGCGPSCAFNFGVSSPNTGLTKCNYVCAPGGGRDGSCELYQDHSVSLCPKTYAKDPTCNGECGVPQNRCENASGKHIPY